MNYVVEQGDSFLSLAFYTEPAQSLADNFAAQGDVLKALHADQFTLLVVCVFIQVHKIFCLHQV